jgi:general secretion pathway protein I
LGIRRARSGSPPSRVRPRAGLGEAGFTLIEVVVAFVLLGLVLSVGFEIFSRGLARAGALEERSRALEVARSHLADAGVEQPLQEGVSQGDSEDRRFHWTTTVTAFDPSADPSHPTLTAYQLYHVQVRVDWRGADGQDHALALSTLGLGARAS